MSQIEKVNITSLGIVHDELVATIETSAAKLEQYAADRTKREALEECQQLLRQASGVFRLIQLQGADLLSDEMADLLGSLQEGDDSKFEAQLGVLTSAFFVLPQYLEYVIQRRRCLPVLLIASINDLRRFNKRPALPESEFLTLQMDVSLLTPPAQSRSMEIDDLPALTRRLRHMYQVGLLNALQGKQVRSALGIMQRALERLDIISCGRPMSLVWHMGGVVLELLRTNNMEINPSRKMMLTGIDRQLKAFHNQGIGYLENEVSGAQIRQLVFVMMLAHRPNAKAQALLGQLNVEPLGFSDQDLRAERDRLSGPSGNTVSSVAAVIQDELHSIKELLETLNESKLAGGSDYEALRESISKVAEILSVVGLVQASSSLKEQLPVIERWSQGTEQFDQAEVVQLADTLLFVESTVTNLETLDVNGDQLSRVNQLSRREVIASTQLVAAELVVLDEVAAGLTLVKRGLNSFAESNYDVNHVKNASTTLNSVRGGFIVLGLHKAAAVVQSCADFVEGVLLTTKTTETLPDTLETFADAIIGLEYYLDSVKYDREADDSVLSIAEESLQDLGYRVRI